MATTINADNGAVSGSAGLKESADSSGVLALQTNGTTAVSISTDQVVTLTNALPVDSGGTGATTSAGAAFALKGANSDITSLSGLTTALSVGQGGTGLATATGVLVGAGSTVSAVAAGTSGNVLTSNGTTWTSATAATSGPPVLNVFTTPGTWTKPATVKGIQVTVVGGGGNGAGGPGGRGGGGGGAAIRNYSAPSLPGPQPYTVGGATATSSFGVAPATVVSATGGTTGGAGGAGTNGQANITGGTGNYGGGGAGQSGGGGSSILGAGAGIPLAGYPAGTAGTAYGGGGSGGSTPSPGFNGTGGAGAAGVVIVEEFY